MSLDLLGDGFDIHGGGQDLAFPHHENERAQSAADGHPFARYWVHHGFVEVDGEKMSKSLGNFTNLMDLIARADPRAYRLLVLRSHYRSPIEVNESSVGDAVSALERLDAFARRTRELAGEPDPAAIDSFREAMDRDMDTPAVSSLLFDLVRRGNSLLDQGDADGAAPLAAAVREIAGAVGLVLRADADEVPAAVADLARRRDEARAAKDWATADALRDELQAQGWVVEDGPTGTVVRRA
jgi:cysteinyl-tRNA synthetase